MATSTPVQSSPALSTDAAESQPADVVQPTILEVLNEDCWRAVFDYLSINDLVRSERVSRRWQHNVLLYLQHVQNYRIAFANNVSKVPERCVHYREVIIMPRKAFFKEIFRKLGPFIVRLESNCIDEEGTKAISLHCPKLESLILSESHLEEIDMNVIPDEYSNDESVTLRSRRVTGSFLSNLRTNLKILSLTSFEALEIGYMRSAIARLTGLTRLDLVNNHLFVLAYVDLLLEVMPDLEHLSLMEFESGFIPTVAMPVTVCRLRHLRELHLWGNEHVTDVWLGAVACCCPTLRVVNVGLCIGVTANGVVTLCRALPSLTELVVPRIPVTDSHLEECARTCGGLRLLDASWCSKLTKDLPLRLAWPRPHPLCLRLRGTMIPKKNVDYEGLTIVWNLSPDHYNPLRVRCDDADTDSSYTRCNSGCGSDCSHGSLALSGVSSRSDLEDGLSDD